jgi:hypothetical protein
MKIPESGLELTRRQVSILDLQTRLELDGDARDLAYTSPIWARFSLPHKDPGAVPFYEVHNGDLSMSIQPGIAPGVDGRMEAKGIPFGVIPRHTLTYLVTEAVQRKDPEVHLGSSLNEFMGKIGLGRNGTDIRRLKTQLERLTWCRVSVTARLDSSEAGQGYRQELMSLATGAELWLNGAAKHRGDPGLWGSSITLSPEFYASVIDKPLPVYLEDLRVLGDSALRLDIYTWLVYRMFYLRTTTRITWAQLHAQFGATYKRQRDFRARFEPALKDVLRVYTGARVTVSTECLTLRPSAPHVRPLDRR